MYRAPQWGPHFQGPQLLPASNSRCLWWSSRHDVQWWSSGCSAKKRWRWESRGSRIFLGGDDMRKMPINIDSFILFWLSYTYTIYFFFCYEIFSNMSLLSLSKSTAIWPFPQPPTACQTYNADSTACTRACLVGEFDTVVVNGNSGDTLVERIGRGSKITRQQQRIKRYVLWVIHYSRYSGCFLLWFFVCLRFFILMNYHVFFTTLWIQHSLWILSILNDCSFQKPIWSMYGIFPYIWLIFMVHVPKYTMTMDPFF